MMTATTDEQIQGLVDALQELIEDSTVPKNVKTKAELIITILRSSDDLSIKVNKAMVELDELSDDANMEPYTRTQIWNIASLLEKLTS